MKKNYLFVIILFFLTIAVKSNAETYTNVNYKQIFINHINKVSQEKYSSTVIKSSALKMITDIAGVFEKNYSANPTLKTALESVKKDNIADAINICLRSNAADTTRLLFCARLYIVDLDFFFAENSYDSLMLKCADYWYIKEFARFCKETGMYYKSEELYSRALQAVINTPFEKEAEIDLAEAYYNLNNIESALKELNNIENSLYPKNKIKNDALIQGRTELLKGKIFVSQNEIEKADECFDKAVNNYNKSKADSKQIADIYMLKGTLYAQTGKYSEAEKALEKARNIILKQSEDDYVDLAQLHLKSGVIFKNCGDFTKARSEINKAIEAIDKINDNDPSKKIITAQTETGLAALNIELKDFRRAEALCNNAYELFCNSEMENSAEVLTGKAQVLNVFANLNTTTFNYTVAQKKYEEALEIFKRLNIVSGNEYAGEYATVCNNIGMMLDNRERYSEAIVYYKQSAEIRKKAAEKYPLMATAYAQVLTGLGNAYEKCDLNDSALYFLNMALEIYNSIKNKTNAEQADYSTVCNNLGILYRKSDEPEKAESFYTESFKIRKALVEKSSAYMSLWGDIQNNMGLFYIYRKDYDLAMYYLSKSVEIRSIEAETNHDVYDNVLADGYDNLAYVYNLTEQFDSAAVNYEKSWELRKRLVLKNSTVFLRDYLNTLFNLADLYRFTGRLNDALPILEELKDTYERLMQSDNKNYYAEIADINHNIALIYGLTDRIPQAALQMNDVLTSYLSLASTIPDRYLPKAASVMNQLGNFHTDLKNYSLAEEYYLKAINLRKSLLDSGYVSKTALAASFNNYGLLCLETARPDKAYEYFISAQNIYKAENPENYNIETVIGFSMTNLNLIQYYFEHNKNGKLSEKYQKECTLLLDETLSRLEPYKNNNKSATYYYDYALQLKKSFESIRKI